MKFTNKLLLALMAVTLVFAVSCSQKDEKAGESASAKGAASAEEKRRSLSMLIGRKGSPSPILRRWCSRIRWVTMSPSLPPT